MSTRPSVLVCRGCCCGTDKHPEVDHAGHEALLRGVAGRFYRPDCLGPCERSNVVVVRAGATRTWFGEMTDDGMVADLAGWIEAGAPSGALPPTLAGRVFDPDACEVVAARRHPSEGDALVDLVDTLLVDPGCAWSATTAPSPRWPPTGHR